MPAIELTPAQRKEKRGEAHHLDPVVMIGADGLTAAVLKEAEVAIRSHGLIKVRVFSDDRQAREALLHEMADKLGAAPVQHIGKLLVLWRPVEDRRPVDRTQAGAAPRVVKILKFSKTGTHRPQIKRVTVLGNERVTAGGSIKRARKRPASIKKQAG
jgi:putative YhbY family RNA-binding protein